jgi:hypothetical protein
VTMLVNCVRPSRGLSTSHVAWDVDAVHGVHAMHIVSKLCTARGQRRVSVIAAVGTIPLAVTGMNRR